VSESAVKLTFAPKVSNLQRSATLQSKEKTAFCVAAANKRYLLFVMRQMLALRKQSITIAREVQF
jgi:hypothetical protein